MTTREDEVIERLKKATAKRDRALLALHRAREELQATILEAKETTSLKQSDIVRLTGYNREHIRRLVRDAALGRPRRRAKADQDHD